MHPFAAISRLLPNFADLLHSSFRITYTARWLNNTSQYRSSHSVTETWHQAPSYQSLNQLCPPGSSYIHKARGYGHGVGLVVYRDCRTWFPLSEHATGSFDHLAFKCLQPHFIVVKPCLTTVPLKPNSCFIDSKFSDFLSNLQSYPCKVIILGNINIHIDCPFQAAEFLTLLDCSSS